VVFRLVIPPFHVLLKIHNRNNIFLCATETFWAGCITIEAMHILRLRVLEFVHLKFKTNQTSFRYIIQHFILELIFKQTQCTLQNTVQQRIRQKDAIIYLHNTFTRVHRASKKRAHFSFALNRVCVYSIMY